MLFRFYSQGKLVADKVTLPYYLSDLTPDTDYSGVYTYTALDDQGNEVGIRKLPDFKTSKSGTDSPNTGDTSKPSGKTVVDSGEKVDDIIVGD